MRTRAPIARETEAGTAGCLAVLLRLAYLTVTNVFAALHSLPMSDRDKDVEILVLRHQIAVLERQLGVATRVRFAPEDRALLAALLTSLPREVLRRLRLLVRPDTALRWHRDLMKRRHARICRPSGPGAHPRSAPSAPSFCAWSGRTRVGATGGSTESSRRSASRSHPPPSGRSSNRQESTRHPNGPPPRGPTSCARKQTPYWPATSSRPSLSPDNASTSWRSSSTPPDASACSAPPHTRARPGSSKRSGIW
jgi:hypothetical protein